MPDEELTWWEIVMYHEAGHAVACLSIWGESADIFLRAITEELGQETYWASFRASSVISAKMMTAPPSETVKVCAAGAQAEKNLLGIDNSKGFGTDRGKINLAINFAKAREDAGLEEAVAEIENGYPATAELVGTYSKALKAIVDEAMTISAQMKANGKLVIGAVILSAARVKELFDANLPEDAA